MRTFFAIVVVLVCCLNGQAGRGLLIGPDDNRPPSAVDNSSMPADDPFLKTSQFQRLPVASQTWFAALVLENARSGCWENPSGHGARMGTLFNGTLQSLDVRLQV